MNSHLSDEQLDTAMRAWARHSINETAAPHYSVHDSERQLDEQPRARRRRLLPALAAAAVLVIAGGLALGKFGEHSTPSANRPNASRAPSCPRHDISGFTTGLPARHADSLFAQPVAIMTACSYTQRLVVATSLGHRLSTQLALHLNNASTTRDDPLQCLAFPSFTLLVARAEGGAILPPVKLTGGCRQLTATNGITVRYIDVDDPFLRRAVELVAKRITPH